jgi:hypothetical protein
LHLAGRPVIIIPPDEFLALLTEALQGVEGVPGHALEEAMRRALSAVEAEARRQFRAS